MREKYMKPIISLKNILKWRTGFLKTWNGFIPKPLYFDLVQITDGICFAVSNNRTLEFLKKFNDKNMRLK